MAIIDEKLRYKINKLYFEKNLTVPEISKKLKIKYNTTLSAINRGDLYSLRHKLTKKNDPILVKMISDEVTKYFGLKDGLINMKTRLQDIVVPRQIAHTISYNLTKSSNAFVGSLIGNVDHASVSHSRSVINQYLDYPNEIKNDYIKLERICRVKIHEYEKSKL
jgi:chromosomal replication initiation ATPase DnaA